MFSKKTKQNIFRYFKKVKSVKKLAEKFSINLIFINTFLKKIKILDIKPKYINCTLNNTKIFNLFCKFKQLEKTLKFTNILNSFNLIGINLLLFNTVRLKKNKINFKIN